MFFFSLHVISGLLHGWTGIMVLCSPPEPGARPPPRPPRWCSPDLKFQMPENSLLSPGGHSCVFVVWRTAIGQMQLIGIKRALSSYLCLHMTCARLCQWLLLIVDHCVPCSCGCRGGGWPLSLPCLGARVAWADQVFTTTQCLATCSSLRGQSMLASRTASTLEG